MSDRSSNVVVAVVTVLFALAVLAALFVLPKTIPVNPSASPATADDFPKPVLNETRNEPHYSDWDAAPVLSSRYALVTDNAGAELIPEENRGEISEVTYVPGSTSAYFGYGEGRFINKTKLDSAAVAAEAEKPLQLEVELYGEPQVLIYHTHATESFDRYDAGYYDSRYPSRSTDNSLNMVSLGGIVADILNANGIVTLQSDAQHDYPAYNGSYGRSRATVLEYLKEYPSIKIILDLHRDAMGSGSVRIKPTAMVNGIKAAQIMIISAADNGSLNHPDYLCNLRLAARIQDTAATMYPKLMRPARFSYGIYNQDLSHGALLIEIGTHANSLTEAQYSAELFANVLVRTLVP